MTTPPTKVVFDCPVYAQAIINPAGPAARCVTHAQAGRLTLFVSDYVIAEVRELTQKLKPRLRVSADRVERFILDLAKYAHPVDHVPERYVHPVDPDDSHYVNLALATGSKLLVTRDNHLLDLMQQSTAVGRDFASRFPTLRVVDPVTLLRQIEQDPP